MKHSRQDRVRVVLGWHRAWRLIVANWGHAVALLVAILSLSALAYGLPVPLYEELVDQPHAQPGPAIGARLEFVGAVIEEDKQLGGIFAKVVLQNRGDGLARGIVNASTFSFFPPVLPQQMIEQRQDVLIGGQDWDNELKDRAGEDRAKGGVYLVTVPNPARSDQMSAFRSQIPNVKDRRSALYLLAAVKYLDNNTQRIVVSEACFLWSDEKREATRCGRQRIFTQ